MNMYWIFVQAFQTWLRTWSDQRSTENGTHNIGLSFLHFKTEFEKLKQPIFVPFSVNLANPWISSEVKNILSETDAKNSHWSQDDFLLSQSYIISQIFERNIFLKRGLFVHKEKSENIESEFKLVCNIAGNEDCGWGE